MTSVLSSSTNALKLARTMGFPGVQLPSKSALLDALLNPRRGVRTSSRVRVSTSTVWLGQDRLGCALKSGIVRVLLDYKGRAEREGRPSGESWMRSGKIRRGLGGGSAHAGGGGSAQQYRLQRVDSLRRMAYRTRVTRRDDMVRSFRVNRMA